MKWLVPGILNEEVTHVVVSLWYSTGALFLVQCFFYKKHQVVRPLRHHDLSPVIARLGLRENLCDNIIHNFYRHEVVGSPRKWCQWHKLFSDVSSSSASAQDWPEWLQNKVRSMLHTKKLSKRFKLVNGNNSRKRLLAIQ